MSNQVIRCSWGEKSQLDKDYHDFEWGRPEFDDQKLFEKLILDIFQAGLSWSTILNKRENFRNAFDNFDPEIIVKYDDNKIDELMSNSGIIRNKRKILATINNAQAYLNMVESGDSLKDFFWKYVDYQPIVNSWEDTTLVPGSTPLSEQITKDLKKLGFTFVGPTIIYSIMQATGMVNDHILDCHVRDEIISRYKNI